MELREKLKHPQIWLWLMILAILLASILVFYYHYSPEGIDDAWITYRYARNLARGDGYAYNPGEKIQGTSTPLFTLLLALMALTGADIPTASIVIALLSLCLTNLIIFFWLRRLQSSLMGLMGVAILLMTTDYMEVVTSGMETATYSLLILLSFYLFYTENNRLTFICGGLCMLMRLDGTLVPIVLIGAYYWKYRSWPIKDLALPVFMNAIWLVFSQIYFGLTLPNSLFVKQTQTGHQIFSLWVLDKVMAISSYYWFLAVIGMAYAVLTNKAYGLSPLMFWSGGYFLAYSFSQLGYFQWYFIPPLVALSFFAAYGLGKIIKTFTVVDYQRAVTLGIICLIGIIPMFRAASTWNHVSTFKATNFEKARYEGAIYAGSHIPPNASIISGGVGMIGWFSDNYVFDFAGLVSPQLKSDRLPSSTYAALEFMLNKYRPMYVFDAMYSQTGWPEVLQQQYHIVASFPHRNRRYTDFVLWERNISFPQNSS